MCVKSLDCSVKIPRDQQALKYSNQPEVTFFSILLIEGIITRNPRPVSEWFNVTSPPDWLTRWLNESAGMQVFLLKWQDFSLKWKRNEETCLLKAQLEWNLIFCQRACKRLYEANPRLLRLFSNSNSSINSEFRVNRFPWVFRAGCWW